MFLRIKDKILRSDKIDYIETVADTLLIHMGDKQLSLDFDSDEQLQAAFEEIAHHLDAPSINPAASKSELDEPEEAAIEDQTSPGPE